MKAYSKKPIYMPQKDCKVLSIAGTIPHQSIPLGPKWQNEPNSETCGIAGARMGCLGDCSVVL